MPEYSYENIDAKLFEHLVVALGQEHIAKGLRPFGSGTDGGREATYEGCTDYPSKNDAWDGYLVIQCKRKESRGATPKEEADWAIKQLELEMKKYLSSVITRKTPEYFIFVTNAELSAKPNDGGKDRFIQRLEYWKNRLGLKGVDVWDRDKLSRLLDSSQRVAQRFGLLHGGDILHFAAEQVLSHRDGVETTLSVFLQEELRADQYVRLAQAGHVGDERTPLAQVFVDLRATTHERGAENVQVLNAILSASDRPLTPSSIELEHLAESEAEIDDFEQGGIQWDNPSRFVIVGGPGQGKSTLAQALAQRHRTVLLSRNTASSLNYETRSIISEIKKSSEEDDTPLPLHPRIPFRIILEHFADSIARKETTSLLDFISNMIRRRTNRDFEIKDAEMLIKRAPILIALDGLDEVPAASNRTDVMEAIRKFMTAAISMDSDMVIIATTRPQGYTDEFSSSLFNHLYLSPLTKPEALNYATKFVDIKYSDDTDRHDRIMQRIKDASEEEATVRLMTSPLQVTIMVALVDVVGNPPRERYPLFNRYYEVVYQREQERGLGSSEILAERRTDIDALHDTAGLKLQIETETAGKAQGRLSGHGLRELVYARLKLVGYEGEELEKITQDLVEVAINRLVFLVPLEQDKYGFEIRSLQEFAAARGLMRRGSSQQVKERLKSIAPVPYWRNTVLFAIGLVFAEREDLSDTIVQLCREINEDETSPALYHSRAGSVLALDILKDGVVDRRPRHRRSLLETALFILDGADFEAAESLADLYRDDDEIIFVSHIQSSISTSQSGGIAAFMLLCILAARDVPWANSLLEKLWPSNLDISRWVIQHIARHIKWTDFLLQEATRIARNSTPKWVSDHMSEHVPTEWIKGVKHLFSKRFSRHGISPRRYKKESCFWYNIPGNNIDREVISRIIDADPIHPDWRPFTESIDFVTNPDTSTLSTTMNSLSQGPDFHKSDYSGFFWPLSVLLETAEDKQTFKEYALRAADGRFGNLDSWQQAENRWVNQGFTPRDWKVFDEHNWPFSESVRESGIAPFHLTILVRQESVVKSIDILRSSLRLAKSQFSKRHIAESINFFIGALVPSNSKTNVVDLNFLYRLSQISGRWIDARGFVNAAAETPGWLGLTKQVEAIGSNVALPGSRMRFAKDPVPKESSHVIQDAADSVIALMKTHPPSENLVRILAGLAAEGAEIKPITLVTDGFSKDGLAAYTILNVFCNGLAGLSEDAVVKNMIELWDHKFPISGDHEIKSCIKFITSSPPMGNFQTNIIDALLKHHLSDLEMNLHLLEAFSAAPAFWTSPLSEPSRRIELGI